VSRRLARFVLSRCVHVSARESESLKELEALFKDRPQKPKIASAPDLSFAMLRDVVPREPGKPDAISRVAFTLVDWPEFGAEVRDRYRDSVRDLIEFVVEEYDCSIEVVPQVVKEWESTGALLTELVNSLSPRARGKVSVPQHTELSVEHLVSVYRQTDCLVATRMHSAIFALSVGTPVIAVPYDKGGKWGILGDLGYSDYMIPYDEVDSVGLRERFVRLMKNRRSVMQRVERQLQAAYAGVDACLQDLGPYIADE
jgi:colanic acid/amylovoran biosynthesis protein